MIDWKTEYYKLYNLNKNKHDFNILNYVKYSKPIYDFYYSDQEDAFEVISLWTSMLAFVKNQTPDLCKMAVRRWGYTICYVKTITDEIREYAVGQNGYVL